MRAAICLLLLVIGTSFLLPSETQKFLLFVFGAGLALLLIKDNHARVDDDAPDALENDEFARHWFDEGLMDFVRDTRSSR